MPLIRFYLIIITIIGSLGLTALGLLNTLGIEHKVRTWMLQHKYDDSISCGSNFAAISVRVTPESYGFKVEYETE